MLSLHNVEWHLLIHQAYYVLCSLDPRNLNGAAKDEKKGQRQIHLQKIWRWEAFVYCDGVMDYTCIMFGTMGGFR